MARRSESLFLLLGLTLAAYAMWGLMDGPAPVEEATPATLPPVTTTEAVAGPPVDEVAEVVEAPPPPPDVDGLSDAITHVLAERGNTELVTRSELLETLPASVVTVLIDNDAVLELADGPVAEVSP